MRRFRNGRGAVTFAPRASDTTHDNSRAETAMTWSGRRARGAELGLPARTSAHCSARFHEGADSHTTSRRRYFVQIDPYGTPQVQGEIRAESRYAGLQIGGGR